MTKTCLQQQKAYLADGCDATGVKIASLQKQEAKLADDCDAISLQAACLPKQEANLELVIRLSSLVFQLSLVLLKLPLDVTQLHAQLLSILLSSCCSSCLLS